MTRLSTFQNVWLIRPSARCISSRGIVRLRRSLIVVSIGGAAVAYQVHLVKERFANLLQHSAIESESQRGMFISAPHFELEINEISNFIAKLVSLKQLGRSLLKGPESLAGDQNPWHLLRILRSESHCRVHKQAAGALATGDYSDGVLQEIAQACDLKVAVKLARIHGASPKLFLPPPSHMLFVNDENVEEVLYKILTVLPEDKDDSCSAYYTKLGHDLANIQKDKELSYGWEHETVQVTRPASAVQVVELYLQALLERTICLETSSLMVKNGLLAALIQVSQMFDDQILKLLSVRIVANISTFDELHAHIFQSGWIGLLVELLRCDQVRVRLVAAKILANMDEAFSKHGSYDKAVYLLHPLFETQAPIDIDHDLGDDKKRVVPSDGPWEMDVIFVHGLLGGVFWTWRQSDIAMLATSDGKHSECWPADWLPCDVPGLRILGVDYATSLSQWRSRCPGDVSRRSIDSRSDELLESLRRAGVGRRPIVWVAHSMGGLLVKQLLVKAWESHDPTVSDIAKKSKAIVMLSVPHAGSSLATLNPTTRFLFLPSVQVDELRKGSQTLKALSLRFCRFLSEQPMSIVSIVETKDTPIGQLGVELRFVEPKSADLGVGETHFVPADHMDVCKPVDRNSFVYKRLVRLLQDVQACPVE